MGISTRPTTGARTGDQFLAGLRGDEREVWLDGEKVTDPSSHPKLEGAARSLAELFDLQHAEPDVFLMESPEYLRFFDSAIEELATRGHGVTIAVTSDRTGKPVGLGGLQKYADKVHVLGMVPQHDGFWGPTTHRLHAVMDFVRYFHPRFAAAPALRARIKRKVLPFAYHWLDAIPQLGAGSVAALQRGLMAADSLRMAGL